MTDTLPKIWNTNLFHQSSGIRNIDYKIKDSNPVRCDALSTSFLYPDGKPLPADLLPEYVFFEYQDQDEKYKANTPDLMRFTGGLLMISEKFRDFLTGFDLGTTLIHEMPLLDYDQKTRRPGRWFLLHITAHKNTVIPEKSENVERVNKGYDIWWPRNSEFVLAVRADAAEGPDLWLDPNFHRCFFVSDRLKTAFKTAGLRVYQKAMRPCIVIT
jgi:hypothetical protein